MPRNRSSNSRRQYPESKKASKGKRSYVVETQQEQIVKVEPNIKKKFSKHDIKHVKPMTQNQLLAFQEWGQGQHLVLKNYAGTGKSFIALYLALQTVLDPNTEQDKIIIVRSAVQTRSQGFLPGTLEEKMTVYEAPYRQICDKLFTWKNSYDNLKEIGLIQFESTSFLRGTTFDNAVIIVDEAQNLDNQSEGETVITRMGENSRIIICGDTRQNDIGKTSGCEEMFKILRKIDEVSFIEFTLEDICRSGFVRSYLMAKYS